MPPMPQVPQVPQVPSTPSAAAQPASPAPPAPVAGRLRLPGWRDRRLAVGVVLLLGSVAAGAAVVGHADDLQPVYAARHPLVPGQRVSAGDLQVVQVRLGRQADRYLAAGRPPRAGVVVIRGVLAGELVPVSAVGPPEAVTSRPVAVPVSAGSVRGLRPGSLVDVWVAARRQQPQSYDAPAPLVSGAEVVSVDTDTGVLSSSADATLRVLLAGDLVPQVLAAVANGARVDVVPVPGSVPRSGS